MKNTKSTQQAQSTQSTNPTITYEQVKQQLIKTTKTINLQNEAKVNSIIGKEVYHINKNYEILLFNIATTSREAVMEFYKSLSTDGDVVSLHSNIHINESSALEEFTKMLNSAQDTQEQDKINKNREIFEYLFNPNNLIRYKYVYKLLNKFNTEQSSKISSSLVSDYTIKNIYLSINGLTKDENEQDELESIAYTKTKELLKHIYSSNKNYNLENLPVLTFIPHKEVTTINQYSECSEGKESITNTSCILYNYNKAIKGGISSTNIYLGNLQVLPKEIYNKKHIIETLSFYSPDKKEAESKIKELEEIFKPFVDFLEAVIKFSDKFVKEEKKEEERVKKVFKEDRLIIDEQAFTFGTIPSYYFSGNSNSISFPTGSTIQVIPRQEPVARGSARSYRDFSDFLVRSLSGDFTELITPSPVNGIDFEATPF